MDADTSEWEVASVQVMVLPVYGWQGSWRATFHIRSNALTMRQGLGRGPIRGLWRRPLSYWPSDRRRRVQSEGLARSAATSMAEAKVRVWAIVRLGQQQSGPALYCSIVHSRDKKYSAHRRHCHWTDCIQASVEDAASCL